MSYTQKKPNTTRFTVLERTTPVTISKNTTWAWQNLTTVGGPATTGAQPAGSLIIAELRCNQSNFDPAAEWQIQGGSVFTARALDQEPNELSTIAGNAYACSVANGTTANSIYITNGGGGDVNETLMVGTHGISYS